MDAERKARKARSAVEKAVAALKGLRVKGNVSHDDIEAAIKEAYSRLKKTAKKDATEQPSTTAMCSRSGHDFEPKSTICSDLRVRDTRTLRRSQGRRSLEKADSRKTGWDCGSRWRLWALAEQVPFVSAVSQKCTFSET